MPVRHGPAPRLCGLCRRRPARNESSGRGPEVVASWEDAVADGTVSARCDEIVRRRHAEQGIPMRLADALVERLASRREAA